MKNLAPVTQEGMLEAFSARFGTRPDFLVRTPGRVNLIGEHTDYNGGFVLPMAIDRAIWLAVRERDDGVVRVFSSTYGEERTLDLCGPSRKGGEGWFEYIKGCVSVLQEEGRSLVGFDALLSGDVPHGAGLSSSGALEVGVLLAFDRLGGYGLPREELARLGQRAENLWVGVQCGIMDQMICAFGQTDTAMLLDCRSLERRFFPLPPGTVFAVMDTGTRHVLAASAYNERRRQCEAACFLLGVPLLRDATQEMLDERRKDIPGVVYRRARHVLSENLRVRAAGAALGSGDIHLFGRLMDQSHFSLQYDFEVSCRELDVITTIARGHPACLGARMTGAGFGGSAVALLRSLPDDDFSPYVSELYRKRMGKEPSIYFCRATGGGSAATLEPR